MTNLKNVTDEADDCIYHVEDDLIILTTNNVTTERILSSAIHSTASLFFFSIFVTDTISTDIKRRRGLDTGAHGKEAFNRSTATTWPAVIIVSPTQYKGT
jgi:hypothetical protein